MTSKQKHIFLSKSINLVLTTAIISLTLTLVNYKGNEFFLFSWLRSWFIAFCVILLLSSFLPKIISDTVSMLIGKEDE
ncbi:DUF2798 domain-containing protein [Carnobacterium sp. FSL E2-0243]|uniref:DUF2798 domain-containing protein n=1 Tax=Carnobacterium sp. FSL E2-0243 TaxID=2921365 RepID=UPI0030F98597